MKSAKVTRAQGHKGRESTRTQEHKDARAQGHKMGIDRDSLTEDILKVIVERQQYIPASFRRSVNQSAVDLSFWMNTSLRGISLFGQTADEPGGCDRLRFHSTKFKNSLQYP